MRNYIVNTYIMDLSALTTNTCTRLSWKFQHKPNKLGKIFTVNAGDNLSHIMNSDRSVKEIHQIAPRVLTAYLTTNRPYHSFHNRYL